LFYNKFIIYLKPGTVLAVMDPRELGTGLNYDPIYGTAGTGFRGAGSQDG
jgi:hypothetical protein